MEGRPATVILGTSRSDRGLDPRNPLLPQPGFNAALPSQTIGESRLLLEALVRVPERRLTTVVLGLDFMMSNVYQESPADFVVDNFDADRKWRLLFSISAFTDSWKTLLQQHDSKYRQAGLEYRLDGMHIIADDFVVSNGGHRKLFHWQEEAYLAKTYKPEPYCMHSFFNDIGGGPIEDLRHLIRISHSHGIKLYLLITPSHARQWETLRVAGLWGKFEIWKRLVVGINEQEARLVAKEPYPLWDFSGYSSISTEAVPDIHEKSDRMTWYWESSHFKPVAGDLAIERMLAGDQNRHGLAADFGVKLNAQNIEEHLRSVRQAQSTYRQTHIRDVTEIELLAKKVLPMKRCKAPAAFPHRPHNLRR